MKHRGDLQIWLQASNQYMLPLPDIDYPGRLTNPPTEIADYARRAENGEDDQLTKAEQLQKIKRMLLIEIDKLKRQLGQISEVVQPQSALEGMTLVLEVIDEMEEDIGRVALRSLTAGYMQGRGASQDYILVKLDMDFFDENGDTSQATFRYNQFQSRIQGMPWCLEFEQRSTKVMDDDQGIYLDSIAIHVNVAAAPEEEEG